MNKNPKNKVEKIREKVRIIEYKREKYIKTGCVNLRKIGKKPQKTDQKNTLLENEQNIWYN